MDHGGSPFGAHDGLIIDKMEDDMKPISSWVLVADGARARILRDVPMSGAISETIEEIEFSAPHQALRDIMSDKPGRSFESTGARRSAMEYHSDPVDQHEQDFADRLAETLDAHRRDKAFTRLVVVASPKMLSHLRKAFPKALADTVFAEAPKDLTKLPKLELLDAVRELMEKA
jgi:protein required for attachment to host cells